FGELDDKYIFVKPESYGLETWADWFAHAVEYIESLRRKLQTGGDEGPGMRKERVPTKIINAWKNLITTIIKEPKEQQYYLALDVKNQGIAPMIKAFSDPKFKAVKDKLDALAKAKHDFRKNAVTKLLVEGPNATKEEKAILNFV